MRRAIAFFRRFTEFTDFRTVEGRVDRVAAFFSIRDKYLVYFTLTDLLCPATKITYQESATQPRFGCRGHYGG